VDLEEEAEVEVASEEVVVSEEDAVEEVDHGLVVETFSTTNNWTTFSAIKNFLWIETSTELELNQTYCCLHSGCG